MGLGEQAGDCQKAQAQNDCRTRKGREDEKLLCKHIRCRRKRGSVGCSEEGRLWLGDAQHTEVFCDEFASASTEMSSS